MVPRGYFPPDLEEQNSKASKIGTAVVSRPVVVVKGLVEMKSAVLCSMVVISDVTFTTVVSEVEETVEINSAVL